jgi:hypothetical protein
MSPGLQWLPQIGERRTLMREIICSVQKKSSYREEPTFRHWVSYRNAHPLIPSSAPPPNPKNTRHPRREMHPIWI